jgi:hypothetical protein
MSHQLDRLVDDIDTALRGLRESMKGMPMHRTGLSLKSTHDKMARAMGTLTTELTDARSAIPD